ncbi:Mur ligase family protein, partial [Methylogaea oryzae]|uniref:Mur ligase family protein n=1 Tax=Methylogaea oryzae TaxID=1295382 RepID=UPI0020D1936C
RATALRGGGRFGGPVGLIADRFYGRPSRRLDVIGITGTNGKTSCSHYIAQALGDSKPCAVMGTLLGFARQTGQHRQHHAGSGDRA